MPDSTPPHDEGSAALGALVERYQRHAERGARETPPAVLAVDSADMLTLLAALREAEGRGFARALEAVEAESETEIRRIARERSEMAGVDRSDVTRRDLFFTTLWLRDAIKRVRSAEAACRRDGGEGEG